MSSFKKAIQLIERIDELNAVRIRLDDCGEDYCEPDELEARQDQAYDDYWYACKALADHLMIIMVDSDPHAVKDMAFDQKHRERMLKLFKSAE